MTQMELEDLDRNLSYMDIMYGNAASNVEELKNTLRKVLQHLIEKEEV